MSDALSAVITAIQVASALAAVLVFLVPGFSDRAQRTAMTVLIVTAALSGAAQLMAGASLIGWTLITVAVLTFTVPRAARGLAARRDTKQAKQ
ncbi:hypothetical protein AB0N09_42035 [Streptomyces erythrochromogenes]|uniref:hypothetical protein n=1 Tax=Streptomyces erythrochromogenes TaxID=285574 RepID=UPI0034436D11